MIIIFNNKIMVLLSMVILLFKFELAKQIIKNEDFER